ncbi:MAG: hypothetical protein IKP68_08095, partial [Clostridia bacterium]|nr:hypothetical protein [Clostridia bacterium]
IDFVQPMFGLPIKNAKKIAQGIALHIQDIAEGEFLSYEAGIDRTGKQEAGRMYSAYTDGDFARISNIASEFVQKKTDEYREKDEKLSEKEAKKKAKTALRTALTNRYKPLYQSAYLAGDTEEMRKIRDFLYRTGAYDSLREIDNMIAEWKKAADED